MDINKINIPNYKDIYKKYNKIFKEFDYYCKRYNIPFSVLYIKGKIINLKKVLRYGDKYKKLGKDEYLIILFHTYEIEAYATYYRIEKLIKSNNKSIKIGISGVTKNKCDILSIDILRKTFENYQLNY